MRDNTEDFRQLFLQNVPLMDVRAPIEFGKGAFPQAVNLPLMNDSERQKVGTQYPLPAVAAAARRHPDALAALLEELRHRLHHEAVVLRLLALELRRVLDVLLRVDAQQVATHREGHGDRVRLHAVARHEDRVAAEHLELLVEEAREDLRRGKGRERQP